MGLYLTVAAFVFVTAVILGFTAMLDRTKRVVAFVGAIIGLWATFASLGILAINLEQDIKEGRAYENGGYESVEDGLDDGMGDRVAALFLGWLPPLVGIGIGATGRWVLTLVKSPRRGSVVLSSSR